jgi:hypothetical protein
MRIPGILLSLSLLAGGLSACGNLITVHDAGHVGITVDAVGSPVIMVMTCTRATPVITLSEGRKPSDPDTKPNVQRGNWRSRTPFTGVSKLALVPPGPTWTATLDPGTLQSDRLFIVDGGTIEDDDASLAPVSFHTQDLAPLTPNQVRVEGKIEPLSTFGAYRCQ